MQERGVITFIGGVVGGVAGYFTPIGPYGGYLVGTAIGAVIEGFVVKDPKDQVFTQESFADVKISGSALGHTQARVWGVNRVPGRVIWASPKIPVIHRDRDPNQQPDSKLSKGGGGGSNTVTEYKTYMQHLAIALCEGPILKMPRMWFDETLVFDIAQPSKFILYTADAQGGSTDPETFPVLAKGADHRSTAQSGILFTGSEEQLPSSFIESFVGQGNVSAYRGTTYLLIRNLDIGPAGRVPNIMCEVVQAAQSLGTPVVIRGISGGAWTAWATEVAEGVEGYGSGDTIFYNNYVIHPDVYGATGGRGTNSLDYIGNEYSYVVVSNGVDETVYLFGSETGERVLGPVKMNPLDLPSVGQVKGSKVIIEHQTVFASQQKITRNEGSYLADGIVYGSLIEITGSQADNNGIYTVSSVIAVEITVFEPLNGDEEAESFTITVLGYGGRVGVVQSVFGRTFGGAYNSSAVTVATICNQTQDLRLFIVEETVEIQSLVLGATPSKIVFDWARRINNALADYYIACRIEGVVKKVTSPGGVLTLTDTISLTGTPAAEDIIIASNGFVYATNSNAQIVWKFTTNANKVAITTNIGLDPSKLAEASDGFVWVANYGERSVSRIDPTTNVATKLQLTLTPFTMTAGQLGSMWIAGAADPIVQQISTTGTVLQTVQVPRFPMQMSTDDQGNIWVLCDLGKTVAMISADGQRVSLPETGNGLACVVRAECERVGLKAEEVDVSGLDVQPVNMTIASVVSARTILEQLAQAYQFTGHETGYSVKFSFKSDAFNAALVKREFLAATASSEPPQATLPIVRHDFLETPTKVVVMAESRLRNYNTDSQSHKVNSHREGINNIVQMNLPLVLDRYEMKRTAQNFLYELLSQRQSYRITLPPRYLLLEPFDVTYIESTIEEEYLHEARFTEVTMGQHLDLEMTGADYKRYVYAEYRSVPAAAQPVFQVIPELGFIAADYVEAPYLISLEDFTNLPRYMIAMYSAQGLYSTSLAFESRDNQETYGFVLSAAQPAVVGVVSGAVPPGPLNTWDDTTEIDITLDTLSVPLSTLSGLQVLNRGNICMVGGEIIYFTTPTLIGPGQYRLSRLLRGRLGTEDKVSTHVSGERFVLLDDYTRRIMSVVYPISRLNVMSYFKTFPSSGNISDASPVTYSPNGRSIMPWAPLITDVSLSPGGDWTVTWLHRSRTEAGDWNNGTGIFYDPDDTGMYEITLYGVLVLEGTIAKESTSGPYGTAEETRTWTYTLAQQTADGLIFAALDVGIKTISTRCRGLEARWDTRAQGLTILDGSVPGGAGGVSEFSAGVRAIPSLRRW